MDFQPPDEYRKVIEAATFAGAIGGSVTIAKLVITKNHGGWSNFFVELVTAVLVAILIGFLLDEAQFSTITKSGIIGICAFAARDIIEILKKIKELLLNDPIGLLKEIINIIRGR